MAHTAIAVAASGPASRQLDGRRVVVIGVTYGVKVAFTLQCLLPQ